MQVWGRSLQPAVLGLLQDNWLLGSWLRLRSRSAFSMAVRASGSASAAAAASASARAAAARAAAAPGDLCAAPSACASRCASRRLIWPRTRPRHIGQQGG